MSEFTKQEVIDGLNKALDSAVKYNEGDPSTVIEICEATELAIAMLEAIPEPEYDFAIGWKGETFGGSAVHIMGEVDGNLIGSLGVISGSWAKDGTYLEHISEDNGLLPNTPLEPEVWYRHADDPEMIYPTYAGAKKAPDVSMPETADDNIQKVEVRVVK